MTRIRFVLVGTITVGIIIHSCCWCCTQIGVVTMEVCNYVGQRRLGTVVPAIRHPPADRTAVSTPHAAIIRLPHHMWIEVFDPLRHSALPDVQEGCSHLRHVDAAARGEGSRWWKGRLKGC